MQDPSVSCHRCKAKDTCDKTAPLRVTATRIVGWRKGVRKLTSSTRSDGVMFVDKAKAINYAMENFHSWDLDAIDDVLECECRDSENWLF